MSDSITMITNRGQELIGDFRAAVLSETAWQDAATDFVEGRESIVMRLQNPADSLNQNGGVLSFSEARTLGQWLVDKELANLRLQAASQLVARSVQQLTGSEVRAQSLDGSPLIAIRKGYDAKRFPLASQRLPSVSSVSGKVYSFQKEWQTRHSLGGIWIDPRLVLVTGRREAAYVPIVASDGTPLVSLEVT